jgi:hypothetical protein
MQLVRPCLQLAKAGGFRVYSKFALVMSYVDVHDWLVTTGHSSTAAVVQLQLGNHMLTVSGLDAGARRRTPLPPYCQFAGAG